jgi:hypothetical protein
MPVRVERSDRIITVILSRPEVAMPSIPNMPTRYTEPF